MVNDFCYTLTHWRLVHLLGITSLRARYARSKFGQAWLSITTFFQILCTGLVWSLLWKVEVRDYLPYVGVGQIVYLFVSQTINESTGVFVADARLYVNDKLPFMLSIGAHFYRNFLILLHNIPTLILLLFWSSSSHLAFSGYFLIGAFLSIIFVVFTSYLFATICTRFRDIIQLIGLLFQIIFLLTPLMWKISFLPQNYQKYAFLNPFACILELIRNPLLSLDVNSYALPSLTIWTLLAILFSTIVYKKMNQNTIYWI